MSQIRKCSSEEVTGDLLQRWSLVRGTPLTPPSFHQTRTAVPPALSTVTVERLPPETHGAAGSRVSLHPPASYSSSVSLLIGD